MWELMVFVVFVTDTTFCALVAFSKVNWYALDILKLIRLQIGYFCSFTGIADIASLLPFIGFAAFNVRAAIFLNFLW